MFAHHGADCCRNYSLCLHYRKVPSNSSDHAPQLECWAVCQWMGEAGPATMRKANDSKKRKKKKEKKHSHCLLCHIVPSSSSDHAPQLECWAVCQWMGEAGPATMKKARLGSSLVARLLMMTQGRVETQLFVV